MDAFDFVNTSIDQYNEFIQHSIYICFPPNGSALSIAPHMLVFRAVAFSIVFDMTYSAPAAQINFVMD